MEIKMKARIQALFKSKYQENGITCYFDVNKITKKPKKFSNPYNDKYGTIGITGFRDDWNKSWDKGQTVSFKLIEQESKGKTYLNFRPPENQSNEGFQKLADLLTEIKETVDTNQEMIKKLLPEKSTQKEPENDDDIPF